MKRIIKHKPLLIVALALVMLISGFACSSGSTDAPEDTDWDFYNTRARTFVTAVAGGDYDTACGMFDKTMSGLVDAEALQEMWDDVTGIAGEFIEIHDIQNGFKDGYFISGVILRCEGAGFGWNVVFSEDGLIAGLNSGGTVPLSALSGDREIATEPIGRDGFTDYPIILGEGTDYPVNGILSIPDDASTPVPAVVIASGSGPNDMDGNIGMVAIYRDIADYLASNGIAVIRFDKRTLTHGAALTENLGSNATVWDEYEDAVFAAELLRADPRIDPDNIYFLGHSLGAMLAPRIHASGGDFSGLIMMAGSPRTLGELFAEQSRNSIYTSIDLGLAQEDDLADTIADLAEMEALFARLGEMSDNEAKSTQVPMFGISAYYFKEMEDHPFSSYTGQINVPVLIMQGGRDFQVRADTDYPMMQEAFSGRSDVQFVLYDDLNHTFLPSTATNFIEHANEILTQTGNVDTKALQDIVDWIKSR